MALLKIATAVVLLSFGVPQAATPPSPIQTCGADQERASAETLSREAIILAADRRLFSPCKAGDHGPSHLEQRDLALLDQAAASTDAEYRRLAVQAFGRFGAPSMAPRIARMLDDASPRVRAEAANAIGQALSGTRSDLRDDAPPTAPEVTAGRQRLEARFAAEKDDVVAGVILATLGRMRHDSSELDGVETFLLNASTGSPDRLLGAAEGFEALARRNPRRPLTEPARARLRDISGLGRTTTGSASETLARLRRLVMTTLQVARDTETGTMLEAAGDPDWQVRRIAVQMMNPSIDRLRPAVIAALKDPSVHVRIEAIRSFARGLQTIRDCGPLVPTLTDPGTLVALQAMDSVTTACADLPAVVAVLTPLADQLGEPSRASAWHRPARALTTLSRLAPEEARKRLPAAKAHASWQVRATAATAAGALNDSALALELSRDATANVRTAAIDALVRLKSPEVSSVALAALQADDHQLVRAAARALQTTTQPDAVPALFASLQRLGATGADTSRDPRVAIVDRLAELLGPTRVGELAAWTADWDTAVRDAAVRAFTAAKVEVPVRPRQYRYPAQPSAVELRGLLTARQADIVLAEGAVITLDLIASDAPMTVARFVSRARAGAYDGLTFHRVVPNFVVQGLSPGANEYVGDHRFMRDEVGLLSHVRGAVGISTRGYDTGDAQIFFDLVDVPRLDHDYTVFAKVTAGLEHMDAILEGTVVRRVVIR
jgi:cyclophilin family peptidyl-prolyl cis-trans isomerase/HEAT repeat protein